MLRYLSLGLVLLLGACAGAPKAPSTSDNLCELFAKRPHWYKAARASTKKWGGTLHLPMAIIYQESGFKARAKPPRRYLLWVIPAGRQSSAYGYSQALDGTWEAYEKAIGKRFRRRSNFAHAYDFIQWYIHQTWRRNQVSKWDYYAQYLNYHEGQGGYARGTHRRKQWLLKVARRVEKRAQRYGAQLKACGRG